MFDFMLRQLPNGRIMVRNIKDGTNQLMTPAQLGEYFEKEFDGSIQSDLDRLEESQRLMDEITKRGL